MTSSLFKNSSNQTIHIGIDCIYTDTNTRSIHCWLLSISTFYLFGHLYLNGNSLWSPIKTKIFSTSKYFDRKFVAIYSHLKMPDSEWSSWSGVKMYLYWLQCKQIDLVDFVVFINKHTNTKQFIWIYKIDNFPAENRQWRKCSNSKRKFVHFEFGTKLKHFNV